jgi:hypothetical protein
VGGLSAFIINTLATARTWFSLDEIFTVCTVANNGMDNKSADEDNTDKNWAGR